MEELLRIEDLQVAFSTEEGPVEALDGVALTIHQGTFHGLIGETGCGKSVTGQTIMGLLDNNARIKNGRIMYRDQDLLKLSSRQMERKIRGNEIAMIFQDPGSSLNPLFTIKNQIEEAIKMYRPASRERREGLILEALQQVKLPDARNLMHRYPHQLSGGMKQRVMIAMMLACNPRLLIADEPTTALDVSIQAQFIKVLKDLKENLDLTILYITHDLAVISELCDYVSVMYAGRIVENLSMYDLFRAPCHPYTEKLVNSVLGVNTRLDQLVEIPGSVPRLINPPPGCRFHPRCSEALPVCSQEAPLLKEVRGLHSVACHRR